MGNKKSIAVHVALMVAGIALIAFSTRSPHQELISIIGGVCLGVAAIRLVRDIRYLRDPEYANMINVSNTDERLRFLATTSAQSAFQITVIALAVLSVVLRLLGYDDTANVLGLVMCGELTTYWVSYLIVSRKY